VGDVFCPGKRAKFLGGFIGVEQGHLRHTFRPSHQKDIASARDHFLGGLGHSFETGGAVPMDSNRGHVFRNSGAQGDDTRDVRGFRWLAHTTQDDFLDFLRSEARLRQQQANGGLTQVHRRGVRQNSTRLREGGADSVNDINCFLHTSVISNQ
jgi:hypothetical protein